MRNKTPYRFLAGMLFAVGRAQGGTTPTHSSRAQLTESIEQLHKTPNDTALREKIIALALKAKPAPTIPEEARRHFVKAVALQKEAKAAEDYDLPIREYRQALLAAPWWSDAYYDLSSALELKEQYAEAIENLKLSIRANPKGPDARAAQDKIYVLEAKIEKADSKENSPAGKLQTFHKGLDGGVWKKESEESSLNGGNYARVTILGPYPPTSYLEIHGDKIEGYDVYPNNPSFHQQTIPSTAYSGPEFDLAEEEQAKYRYSLYRFRFNEDRQMIILQTKSTIPSGDTIAENIVYKRIK